MEIKGTRLPTLNSFQMGEIFYHVKTRIRGGETFLPNSSSNTLELDLRNSLGYIVTFTPTHMCITDTNIATGIFRTIYKADSVQYDAHLPVHLVSDMDSIKMRVQTDAQQVKAFVGQIGNCYFSNPLQEFYFIHESLTGIVENATLVEPYGSISQDGNTFTPLQIFLPDLIALWHKLTEHEVMIRKDVLPMLSELGNDLRSVLVS